MTCFKFVVVLEASHAEPLNYGVAMRFSRKFGSGQVVKSVVTFVALLACAHPGFAYDNNRDRIALEIIRAEFRKAQSAREVLLTQVAKSTPSTDDTLVQLKRIDNDLASLSREILRWESRLGIKPSLASKFANADSTKAKSNKNKLASTDIKQPVAIASWTIPAPSPRTISVGAPTKLGFWEESNQPVARYAMQ
jgi:hypothetical protein